MNKQPLRFRAWDVDLKQFRDLICINCDKDDVFSCTFRGSEHGNNFEKRIKANDGTTSIYIDQYIGVDDIDGEPMYRGDIVLTPHGHIRVIEHDGGAFHARVPEYEKGRPTFPVHFWSLQPQANRPRKIGNIYENPEMLIPGYEY